MNSILKLKGKFINKKYDKPSGSRNIPSGASISVDELESKINDLQQLEKYWNTQSYFEGALISVHYNRLIAKTNRIAAILYERGTPPNESIVGARFSKDKKHIITHYVKKETIVNSIQELKYAIEILNKEYNRTLTNTEIENINKNTFPSKYKLKCSRFKDLIVDCYYVEYFGIDNNEVVYNERSIVSLFDTNTETVELLKSLNINILENRVIENNTVLLDKDEIELIKSKAPYLISMSMRDFSNITPDDIKENNNSFTRNIPLPSIEPTIGVIDTLFDKSAYFSKWVDFRNMLNENIPDIENKENYKHGTRVSSIIVDGPQLNPRLNDNCGRFRVRHFGVALHNGFSAFNIIKQIKNIVLENKDIKVWNLSLGSDIEIEENFVSPIAYLLDKIQVENDVIFVIAGTNDRRETKNMLKIASPADSINALVVNSVNSLDKPTTYSRRGPVLSFYIKPDVSYYGGDSTSLEECMNTIGIDNREDLVSGTSYAAPWIARKLAYLIHILGFSKEEAKALIIDSAEKWENKYKEEEIELLGHGIVPIDINNIIKSRNDEIRFVISGYAEMYETYNLTLPIPVHNNKYPFIAKATMCYFSTCNRSQGVDYTNEEMDLKIGRINDEEKIKPINKDGQGEIGTYVNEKKSRNEFRKWDNSKTIKERYSPKNGERESYKNKLWGIKIVKSNRFYNKSNRDKIKFGLVVTLKEINGENRINEFIQRCFFNQWLVERVEVDNQIEIYNRAEEEITFEK